MDPISDGEDDDDDEYRVTFKPMTTTTIQKKGKIFKGTAGKTKGSKFLNERNRAVGKWSHQTINQRKYVQCLSSKLTSKKI